MIRKETAPFEFKIHLFPGRSPQDALNFDSREERIRVMEWLTSEYGAEDIQPQPIKSKSQYAKTRYMFKIMDAEKAYQIYDSIDKQKYFLDTD